MRRALALFVLPSVLATLACSSSDAPISIDITTGQEASAFSEAGVTNVVVTVSGAPIDTTLNLRASASPDGGTFDFGDIPDTEQITVTAQGFKSDSSTAVMTGQSLSSLLLSAVSGDLPVFIQQRGQWARPPGGLACSHVNGVVSVQEDRGFMITGGTQLASQSSCEPSGIDIYDMFGLTGDQTSPAYGDVPATIVSLLASDNSADAQGLFITSAGGTFWDYDTAQENTGCPAGFTSWSEVAGATPVAGDSGVFWVVGGTRQKGASDAVLLVGADCTTSGYTLSASREGAAAAWIENIGLLVAGGSSDGPGFELLPSDSITNGVTSFTALCTSTPIPTKGASIVPYGAVDATTGFWLVGGMNGDTPHGATLYMLSGSSTSDCGVPYVVNPSLPALTNTTAFLLSGSTLLFGTDSSGMNASFLLAESTSMFTSTAVPFREPRRGASAIVGPTGAIGLIGGEHADGTPALSIELFVQ